jgi:hypothetical protein
MKNITLSMDDGLLNSGRRYAKIHHTSLNELIRKLLGELVRPQANTWLDTTFSLMDCAKVKTKSRTWKRDELYDA